MITLGPAAERGHANLSWLDSWHSFSFAGYSDPDHVQWGPLRVINEDRVAAGRGCGEHAHRDMDIISYLLGGALGHKDSMGNSSSIVPGDVQGMSAGTGERHSEFNHSQTGQTHFLQIRIIRSRQGVTPGYAQKHFATGDKRGRMQLVVNPDGAKSSVRVHQDARMYSGLFDADEQARLPIGTDRLAYVHLARGTATVNGHRLKAGDALLYVDEDAVSVSEGTGAEMLVFDLPPG